MVHSPSKGKALGFNPSREAISQSNTVITKATQIAHTQHLIEDNEVSQISPSTSGSTDLCYRSCGQMTVASSS